MRIWELRQVTSSWSPVPDANIAATPSEHPHEKARAPVEREEVRGNRLLHKVTIRAVQWTVAAMLLVIAVGLASGACWRGRKLPSCPAEIKLDLGPIGRALRS